MSARNTLLRTLIDTTSLDVKGVYLYQSTSPTVEIRPIAFSPLSSITVSVLSPTLPDSPPQPARAAMKIHARLLFVVLLMLTSLV